MNRTFSRGGFTAIEILTVLVVMAILSTLAMPRVLEMLRESAVRSGAQDIATTWQKAQSLAMRQKADANQQKHYGILVKQDQDGGWCALVCSSDTEPSVNDIIGERIHINPNVVLVSESSSSGGVQHGESVEVSLYAQYGTGSPIDPRFVSRPLTAPPTAIGLGHDAFIKSPHPVLRIQTYDYDPTDKSGFSYDLQILPTGAVTVKPSKP